MRTSHLERAPREHGGWLSPVPGGRSGLATILRRLNAIPARLVMLGSFGGVSLINYAFGLAMGWLLIPGDFGLLAFAQTILLIAALILQSGVAWSLARSIASAPGDRHGPLVRGSLLVNLLLAGAMVVVIASLFILGPLSAGFESARVLAVTMAPLPFMAVVAIARSAAQGNEDFSVMAGVQLLEVATKAGAGVALILLGLGVEGAIAGFFLGSLVASLVGLWYLARRFRLWRSGSLVLPELRMVGPMFASLIGLTLLLHQDLLILKLVAGEHRSVTGHYQAGLILAKAPYFLAASVLVPYLYTHLSRCRAVAETGKLVGETLALALVFIIPIELLLAAAPDLFLGMLFPAAYAPGADALRILAVGNGLMILVAILAAAFQAVGRAIVPAIVLSAVALGQAGLLLAVVPSTLAIGAATIFVAAAGLALVPLVAIYLRELRVSLAGDIGSWLLRYAGALLLGALLMIVTGSALGAEAGLLASAAGYLAGVLWLRVIPRPRFTPRVEVGQA